MPTFTEYKIAAARNNVAGLALIGSIVPSSNIAFAEPAAQQNYRPGKIIPRLDNLTSEVGINSQVWLIDMTWEQYRYIQTTYCGGGFGGEVTIRTRWQNKAYANYSATLRLQSENLNFNLIGYHNVEMTFWDLVVIP